MHKLIVVDQPKDWEIRIETADVISSKEYLTNPEYGKKGNYRVFNLANEYKYQSIGYYVSMVAEARGHKPTPDIKNIVDFKAKTLTKILSEDIEEKINNSLKHLNSETFVLSVYFGKNTEKKYNELAKELHQLFRAPMLRATFQKNSKGWSLQSIKTIARKDVPENHWELVLEYAQEYFNKKRFDAYKGQKYQYDLAILVDSKDPASASDDVALNKFIEVGAKMGIYVELIYEKDYNRISAFDALFVRMNTHVKNYSYKFVRKAEAEGLAVIDHSENILRCGSKIYMTEVLQQGNIPTPKTHIIHSNNWQKKTETMSFPFVVKLPDSTFSFGVKKVRDEKELKETVKIMFAESDLLIVQEFMFTDFDWRIGILDGKPLYACKYFMAKGHWQIYNWDSSKKNDQTGMSETLPIEEAPKAIVDTALKASLLINKQGLFGVDMKEIDGKPYVIEVNDNPNIDANIEDEVLKDELYRSVLNAFKKRIENKINIGNEKGVQV
jgi:glutathione synthase/RimK-type ligase-like ATP-grasp enzyme